MKPPKHSKKVFSGVLFDVYQWKQKMYDGSFETFEMISREPSVSLIATIDNKIIILHQRQPTKSLYPALPGGRVEKGNTFLQTAKRELLEETGHIAEKLIKFKDYFGSHKIYFPEKTYVARGCKKIAEQNLDSGERIKVALVSFNDFLQLCRNEKFAAPRGLKFIMHEALLDKKKKAEFKKAIFG